MEQGFVLYPVPTSAPEGTTPGKEIKIGDSVVGSIVDPTNLLTIVNSYGCIVGSEQAPRHQGTDTSKYDLTADASANAAFNSLFHASLNTNFVKSVEVDTEDVQLEQLQTADQNTGCGLGDYNASSGKYYYVQAAKSAGKISYKLLNSSGTQINLSSEGDVSKAINGSISISGDWKASNSFQYQSPPGVRVYFAVALKTPLPQSLERDSARSFGEGNKYGLPFVPYYVYSVARNTDGTMQMTIYPPTQIGGGLPAANIVFKIDDRWFQYSLDGRTYAVHLEHIRPSDYDIVFQRLPMGQPTNPAPKPVASLSIGRVASAK